MSNLEQLQQWLIKNNIDAFILIRTDEFLSEFIAPYAERLNWISNFSGSAGKAIIMQTTAYIFVDGRYTVQVQEEVNMHNFNILPLMDFHKCLETNLKKNNLVGIDPNHHAKKDIESIKKITNKFDVKIQFLESNPIDLLWKNQPIKPNSKAFQHDLQYCGKSIEKKISQVKNILQTNQCDYYVFTALDSIAWLLNLRGNDILYTPLNLAYIIITPNKKIELFINEDKIIDVKIDLEKYCNFHLFESIHNFIKKIPSNVTIGIDEGKTPFFFEKIFREYSHKFKYFEDPCTYPKAQKNSVELQGARNANIRDGISVTKFLYWLKNEINTNKNDEINAAQKLFSLRKNNDLFYSLSFETISAVNQHAALPHYRVSQKSNLKFYENSIYLVDSGAQYLDGTTDITRTVILGTPTKEQKDRFTRVLKGHIAISTCDFKQKTKGSFLDPLARKYLQEIGCDYEHGTGHGIGSFLSVHEGPQKIAKNQGLSEGNIKEGMILSNEPGFYKEGEYGIRIENLIIVKRKSQTLLNFEVISWAPIDVDLIEFSLLTYDEIKWINWYHQEVFNKLSDKLNNKEKTWLFKVTQPIS